MGSGTKVNLPSPPPLTGPVARDKYWCYMDGVGTFGGTSNAALGFPGTGGAYYTDITKGTTLWWNCLPLSQ